MTDRDVPGVEFHWRPGCPFCFMLRLRLRRRGIPLAETDIWKDPAAAARVRAATGGDETVPTVFVGPAAMVNPHPDEVVRAVRAHAPHLLRPDGVDPG
ncbi:glutaredoxin domain-containing protein [Streptomonospora wellingtoniae]|uniref:Glutaredoxin domain-containing protein n=1 Tax=Streptomonospora wellingtoniae TaxID=3075544 RepID=A0ABU2KRH2_9ACTN|nr:glutaredoxin domain-containing protein [Streptomonospora sp. DSM 45055]MDT0301848.1 glutaredoxin domain-containing protein [Streptomonospora sp. DSM 45055]